MALKPSWCNTIGFVAEYIRYDAIYARQAALTLSARTSYSSDTETPVVGVFLCCDRSGKQPLRIIFPFRMPDSRALVRQVFPAP